MNPNMMPLPYYGGPPGGMQNLQMNPQMDPRMLQYLQQQQQQQRDPLTADQVWPFAHPGKSGAPDLPDNKKKQQQQQQKGGAGIGQLGMNMLYPGGAGTSGFPYGMSPQMWSSMGQSISSPWGQS